MKLILLFLITINLFASSLPPYEDIYENYIIYLKTECKNSNCCLHSVSIIEKNLYFLNKDVDNCKNINMLKCIDSLKWCEDKNIYTDKENEYYNNMEE